MASGSEQDQVKRPRRPRVAQACERCRQKKYKCDEHYPCTHCKNHKAECTYKALNMSRAENLTISHVRFLEKKIEQLSAEVVASRRQAMAVAHAAESSNANGPAFSNFANGEQRSCSSGHAIQGSQIPISNDNSASAGTLNSAHGLSGTNKRPPSLTPSSLPESLAESSTVIEKGSSTLDEAEQCLTEDSDKEVTGMNNHTLSSEFHGNTSSVAFLDYLHKKFQNSDRSDSRGDFESSLVSALHNDAFLRDMTRSSALHSTTARLESVQYYFRQAHQFLKGYFEQLHYIHPFLDKNSFMARAEDLWFGRTSAVSESFIALYLSTLSLGALIGSWDSLEIEDKDRFQWSRQLFNDAQTILRDLQYSHDLETVQCSIIMAKVCQNELNPHLAYMYLGQACRICLSLGFNREMSTKSNPEQADSISKTWWGLYSLEIEMSFSLGRPDTLGMDEYHNQIMPPINNTETDLIPLMVDCAKIMRKVSIGVYHSNASVRDKLDCALQLNAELTAWAMRLPLRLKPANLPGDTLAESLRDPRWIKRQRLVLQIRFYNIQMLLFRPFLVCVPSDLTKLPSILEEAIQKCVESARATIDIIYDIYRTHTFFQTWWYNTTYVMFAVTMLLLHIKKFPSSPHKRQYLISLEKCVQILNAMDASVVARRLSEIVTTNLEALKGVDTPGDNNVALLADADPYMELNREVDFSSVMLNDSLFDGLPDLLYEEWASNISLSAPPGPRA
ncbi:C6 transcription factor [Myxozyma melibiosi]|uniref:C6 transcription factor n=1 Tax=Myxozyma melibiosi TaxID=54550 RepID=A0ABR1EXX3_9ASCO